MASSKLMGFTSSYAEILALAFANSLLIVGFYASHLINCFWSSSPASAANLATLILSSSSFFLDDFDPLEDLDSFDIFYPFDVFDIELLLLLDEFFDSLSTAYFNQHVIYLLKENTWLSLSSNHSCSLTLASSKSTVYFS